MSGGKEDQEAHVQRQKHRLVSMETAGKEELESKQEAPDPAEGSTQVALGEVKSEHGGPGCKAVPKKGESRHQAEEKGQ